MFKSKILSTKESQVIVGGFDPYRTWLEKKPSPFGDNCYRYSDDRGRSWSLWYRHNNNSKGAAQLRCDAGNGKYSR